MRMMPSLRMQMSHYFLLHLPCVFHWVLYCMASATSCPWNPQDGCLTVMPSTAQDARMSSSKLQLHHYEAAIFHIFPSLMLRIISQDDFEQAWQIAPQWDWLTSLRFNIFWCSRGIGQSGLTHRQGFYIEVAADTETFKYQFSVAGRCCWYSKGYREIL